MNNAVLLRAAAAALGCVLVVGGAGSAFAANNDDEMGNQQVGVAVQIDAIGALTLSVASGSTALSEVASTDPDIRAFSGALPDVTVTDDRQYVPAGVFWYVTGQASALTSGQNSIDAGHLGWTPKMVIAQGNGEVAEGDPVATVLDPDPVQGVKNNVGLVGNELLALSLDAQSAAAVGSWTAGADLLLKVPKAVAPGAYSGTITITLWEGEQTSP